MNGSAFDALVLANFAFSLFSASTNLWTARRAYAPVHRWIRLVTGLACLYIGVAYGAYLLEWVGVEEMDAIYVRPMMAILLGVLTVGPLLDLSGPAELKRVIEQMRAEKDRIVEEFRRERNALIEERRTLLEQRQLLFDELLETRQELKSLRQQVQTLEAGKSAEWDGRFLLAAVADSAFDVDLATLRKVERVTGMRWRRLYPVRRKGFERKLERERMKGRPIRWLHLACHAGPDGVEFADGVVDGTWLSEQLRGVEILVIAGCQSDFVGDDLGVVPYVITLAEDVENRDASLFAEAFWTEMAQGRDPDSALDNALERCPPVLREFVEKHW